MNPHRELPTSLTHLVASLWEHRSLTGALIRREVIGRYRGSVFGVVWSFFNPVLMLIVYTFVFSVVFKARWGETLNAGHADFAVVLFVGMIVHGLFSEVINRAPGLILANASYVKRVVFPLEILPIVAMGSALFHTTISLIVLLLAQLILSQHVPWTAVLFPIVLVPLVFATMGVAWFLASVGVFVRDVGQSIGIVTTIMLFLAPVFYPISALPPGFQIVMRLNPLTLVIEEGRKLLLFGQLPDWAGLAVYWAVSIVAAWAGFLWFQKTRRGFADVV